MLEITRLTVEHLTADCVTDCPAPHIAFAVRSDRNGAQLTDAELTVGDWSAKVTGDGQTGTTYKGPALLPFTTYSVQLAAKDDAGETAAASMTFEPVAAALFGFVLFNQTMDGFGIAGIVCELAALVLLQMPARTNQKEG